MKKCISILLVVAMLLAAFSSFGISSSAAVTVENTLVQKNINDFVTFLKSKGHYNPDGFYAFSEKAYQKSGTEFALAYCYYVKENLLLLKAKAEYDDVKVNFNVSVAAKYDGIAKFNYAYSDSSGETLYAQSHVSIPAFNGFNASFKKTGGNSKESAERIQSLCNRMANIVVVELDNTTYEKGRIATGINGFGFANMCARHVYESGNSRATFAKNGVLNKKVCHWCAHVGSAGTVIQKVASVQLSKTAFYYNGKVQTPTVIVKDAAGKLLKANSDYTLSYSKGRKAVGKYAVKVTLIGKYAGTKTLCYTINPLKTQITKTVAGKASAKVQWSKVSGVSGYQVQYAPKANFSGAKALNVKGAATTATLLKNLTAKSTCYVRVRSYKSVLFGSQTVTVFSGWSAVKSVAVK
ncbi:MAG: fibronectin type III domain-containing protein [Clostridia bacterium]|nr:fibronectin type III domain-containing protein [Clostridia bacterium]